MAEASLLITECLQNDFVRPLRRFEPLPNRLHIGYGEARRLMGADPAESPVARVMEWAYAQPDADLALIHIRDWHAPDDARQRRHLEQFGEHCMADTDGAAFVFDIPENAAERARIIDSPTLNDFHDTGFADALAPFAGAPRNVGLMGVWTEAKIFFLAYELATRYPEWTIGVCSALTASSSRARHFEALDQLRRILRVRVCESVGDFLEFLGGAGETLPLPDLHAEHPAVELDGDATLADEDEALLRYLFRDCRGVRGRVLDGGFSGNVVLGVESVDLHGREQAPHVVKIGERSAIGRERTAFERIEEVLGNAAPRISDFADFGERGALTYRYASMSGSDASTFQKRYTGGMPEAETAAVLRKVFVTQLGRLYRAAEPEPRNLLEYYIFDPKWAPGVRAHVEELLGGPADADEIRLDAGPSFYNPARFYERDLATVDPLRADDARFAWVHGDLNGANIILDGRDNVWIIDFFHAHRGHVLRDLVKLENDLLYIFTPVPDADALADGMRLTDLLLSVEDLGAPLPDGTDFGVVRPDMLRALAAARVLRSFYGDLVGTDRDPLQWRIAALRYAVHTLGFDEPDLRQRQWALYSAGRLAEAVLRDIRTRGPLRIDWIDPRRTGDGRVGVTILPGRKDQQRDIDADLDAILADGVTDVLCLLPRAELAERGVGDLLERYAAVELNVRHQPILDQKVPALDDMAATVAWMRRRHDAGARILVHCTGGLGRSGTAAACFLVSVGLSADDAVAEVRRARSRRAVETREQERFVEEFAARFGTGDPS